MIMQGLCERMDYRGRGHVGAGRTCECGIFSGMQTIGAEWTKGGLDV